MFEFTATYEVTYDYDTKEHTHHVDKPTGFEAIAKFPSPAHAREFAAQYPKYLKLRVIGYSGIPGITACVNARVTFHSDKVTGEKNEQGIKRVRKLLEIGGTWKRKRCINAYHTRDDFLSALT